MAFAEGFYDQLLTEKTQSQLAELASDHQAILEPLAAAEVHERATEGLHTLLAKLLDDMDGEKSKPERASRQIAIVNELLAELRQRFPQSSLLISDLHSPPQVLRAVFRGGRNVPPPEMGLVAPWLFTAGKQSPSLLTGSSILAHHIGDVFVAGGAFDDMRDELLMGR